MHSIESTSNRMHLICQKVLSVHISKMMRYREKPDISSSWRLSHWSSVLISEMCLLVHTNCWCQLYQEVSSWHKEPPNDFLYMHWPIFGTIGCRPGAELWFVKHRLVHCLQQIAIKKELWQNSAACLWKCNVIQCYFQMYIARWKCWSCNIKCNSVKHAPPATCETMNRWNRGIWIIASTRTGSPPPPSLAFEGSIRPHKESCSFLACQAKSPHSTGPETGQPDPKAQPRQHVSKGFPCRVTPGLGGYFGVNVRHHQRWTLLKMAKICHLAPWL